MPDVLKVSVCPRGSLYAGRLKVVLPCMFADRVVPFVEFDENTGVLT